MTAKEWGDSLEARVDLAAQQALVETTGNIRGKIGQRVFEDGKDSQGVIHQYDDSRELWVQDIRSPQGKKNDGKAGRAKKTSYFSSYKAFRGEVGRPNDKVNLKLTNELQSDFLSTLAVGELSVGIGVKEDFNADKIAGNDKRFNTSWFTPSEDEKKQFYSLLSDNFLRRLNA
jgi:hypothetical protein